MTVKDNAYLFIQCVSILHFIGAWQHFHVHWYGKSDLFKSSFKSIDWLWITVSNILANILTSLVFLACTKIIPHTHHITNFIQYYIVDFYTAPVMDVSTSINICTLNKSIGFFQKVSIFTVSLYCYFTTTFYLHNIFVIGLLSYHRFHFNLIHLNHFFCLLLWFKLSITYTLYIYNIWFDHLLFYILSIEYSVFVLCFSYCCWCILSSMNKLNVFSFCILYELIYSLKLTALKIVSIEKCSFAPMSFCARPS